MPQQEVEVLQYWVRNDKAKVWGPLTFATIEMFFDGGVFAGRMQASVDGENFADPGRFSDVRDAFPKDLWGSTEPLPASFLRPNTSFGTGPARPARPGAAPAGPPVVGRPGTAPAIPAGALRNPNAAIAKPAGTSKPAPAAPKAAAPAPAAPVTPVDVPGEGTLTDLSAFRLYYLLAAQNAGGKLTIESGSLMYKLLLKKGVPQQVVSSAKEDGILLFLRDNGLLTPEGVAQAEEAAPQFGNDPVAAAFARSLLKNPGAVMGAITAHGLLLLGRMLQTREGRFWHDPSTPPPGGAMPLGDKWKVLAQVGRTLDAAEARRRLGDRMDKPVMKSGERVTLPDLGLNAQEARVASMFEGVRSPNQLAEAIGDADLVARVCYLLGEVELASFADVLVSGPNAGAEPEPEVPDLDAEAATVEPEPEPEPAPPPAPAPPPPKPAAAPARPAAPVGGPPKLGGPAKPKAPAAPGRPAVAPAGPPKVAPAGPPRVAPAAAPKPAAPAAPQDAASLEALLTRQSKMNHFEVLGLQQTATAAQVKAAYLQAVKTYHPDSTPANAPPEVRGIKEQIFARINEANNVLSDETLRAEHLDNLAHGGSDEKVDVEAIFKAEELFTRACIVLKARKYPESLKMFDEALALNDQEAEFHAWRAWAEFMCATDRKAALAPGIAAEQKALKLNGMCAPAAFFSGQMYKLVGDNPAALKWFNKTLELDPNHLEAKSEVRALGAKG